MNKKIFTVFIFVASFFLLTNQVEAWDASCGSADGAVLAWDATSWGGLTACNPGSAVGFSWPQPGQTINWRCDNGNGIADSAPPDAYCNAYRSYQCDTFLDCPKDSCKNVSCTNHVCVVGSNLPVGTSCSLSPVKVCDGSGNCVAPSCSDSDGGIVPNTRGTVTGTGSDGYAYTVGDQCAGEGTVIERYCSGSSRYESWKACDSGYKCVENASLVGACEISATPPVTPTCSESDGGDKPFIAGSTTFSPVPTGASSPAYDHCEGNVLTEYYCNGDSTLGKSVGDCSYYYPSAFCNAGKCNMLSPALSVVVATSEINLGESFDLLYSVENADFCWFSTSSSGSGMSIAPGPTYIDPSSGVKGWSVTPTTVGTKTYTISCSNANGTTTESESVVVSSGGGTTNTAPTAIINTPTGNVSNPTTAVSFSGYGTDPNGDAITGYKWTLGSCDGTVLSSSASFSRTFSTTGTIYFSVMDNQGAWSTNCPSRTITVSTTCSPGYFLYNGSCTANPIGFFDEPLTCTNGTIRAVGWAFDGNDVSASINVNFYNGTTATTLLGSTTANVSSPDVTAYFANLGQTVTGNHRFIWEKTGMAAGTYTISAFAQNTGVGANTNLGAKTVTCSTSTLPTTPALTASCDSSGLVSASWTAVSGADYYALRIDTDTALPHLLQVDNLTTTSRTWQGTVGTSYNVWVHSIDNGVWSDYSLKTVTCSATPSPPVTYECTGTLPTGTIAWDSEENDDLTRDTAWLYSSSDTIRKCELTCRVGYVRIGSVCVAGPTLNFNISKITDPEGIENIVNTTSANFLIESSAEFTYAVSGTSAYPVTSCEASVSSANGGNWTGQKLYSDGTYIYPGITPLITGSYTYYLTCYNSVGAYTTKYVRISIVPCGGEVKMGGSVIVTGSNRNRDDVYGSGPYTTNSVIAKAAVHAGLVAEGETKTITITPVPKCISSFIGSTAYGVTSDDYYSPYYGMELSEDAPSSSPHCENLNCSLLENCEKPAGVCVDSKGIPTDPQTLCIPACASGTCPNCPTNPPTDGDGGWEEVTP